MDPIFDRLGRLFRSWTFDTLSEKSQPSRDADQVAAEEELEAFLKNEPPPRPRQQGPKSFHHEHSPQPQLDPKLVSAYQVMGLNVNASWEEIETAHKKLLRIHHPDRHTENPISYKEATQTSQRINEAYQILKSYKRRL
ncbi:MAG: J domain-containing protein [Spirochaetales bacterium]|nr:J domain-containing protein [Spirochaetales bacterium]